MQTEEAMGDLKTEVDHYSSQLKRALYGFLYGSKVTPMLFKPPASDAECIINGAKFVVSDILCCFPVPNKIHRKTKRMSDSYHSRVQKKWNKRHGVTVKDHSYYTNGVMIASSRTLNELKKGRGYATD